MQQYTLKDFFIWKVSEFVYDGCSMWKSFPEGRNLKILECDSVSCLLIKGIQKKDNRGKEAMATGIVAGSLRAIASGLIAPNQNLEECVKYICENPHYELLVNLINERGILGERSYPIQPHPNLTKKMLCKTIESISLKISRETNHPGRDKMIIEACESVGGILDKIRSRSEPMGNPEIIPYLLTIGSKASAESFWPELGYSIALHGLTSSGKINLSKNQLTR